MTTEQEQDKGIPKDWKYIDGYPVAWIREWGCAIQCLCPKCDYAKGYNQPISMSFDTKTLLKCPTCNTEFIGLVMGRNHTPYVEIKDRPKNPAQKVTDWFKGLLQKMRDWRRTI